MYAVIRTGGKQHKVKKGDVIEVELLDTKDGAVTFQPLLVVEDDGTTHYGKDAARGTVTGTLVGEQKGDKVRVFTYKNKTGYARKTGHRQRYALVEIGAISLGGKASAGTSA